MPLDNYVKALEKVKTTFGQPMLFSVQRYDYSDPPLTRLKFLLDEDTQFTCRIEDKEWEKKVLEGKVIKTYFSDLFESSMIKGEITMRDIMSDAVSATEFLDKNFKIKAGSIYTDNPYEKDNRPSHPIGTHFSEHAFFTPASCEKKLLFHIADENEECDITGTYELLNTGKLEKDPWGSYSLILELVKLE